MAGVGLTPTGADSLTRHRLERPSDPAPLPGTGRAERCPTGQAPPGSIEQKTPNQLAGKASVFEKSGPPGQFPALPDLSTAELGVVHLRQQRAPLAIADLQVSLDQLGTDAALLQLPADAYRSLALADAALDEGFGEALIALQAGLPQLVEHLLQQFRISLPLQEFTLQFLPRMLAGRQQSDCRSLDTGGLLQAQASASASASSVSLLGSSSARIRRSISLEISGFSLRKLRTFSLP